MNKWIGILALCFAGAMGAQAAVIDWTGSGADTEWNTLLNWSTTNLPGATAVDRALLAAGDHATITTAVDSPQKVDLHVSHSSATLAIGADFARLRRLWNLGGTVTQTAGSLVFTDTVSNNNILSGGSWIISGGSFGINGDLAVNAGGTFSVIGSVPSVSVGNGPDDNLVLAADSSLQFTMDAAGVSPISVTDQFIVDPTNAILTVNVSLYEGGATDIDLVTFSTNTAPFATNMINVVGAKSWSVGYDTNSMFISFVPYVAGDTVLLGEDDFDGSALYASRTFSGTANSEAATGSTFGIFNRETVKNDAILDTTVVSNDFAVVNTNDTVGYLDSTLADNNHLAINRAGDRTLTYTFNIEGYNNLKLDADWIIGDGWYSDVAVEAVIDGGPTSTVFLVDTKGETWGLEMESGAVITNVRAAQVYANGVSQGSLYDSWASVTGAITNGTGSVLTLIVSEPSSFRGSLGMDNLKLYGDVAPKPGDTVAVGSDDFDTTGTYASRTIVGGANSAGGITWNIVSRDNIQYPGIIDTSVAAGGVVGIDANDVLGFLGTNKTDNIFGMYRAGAGGGGRTLTYTFDITNYTNLNLWVDWAASGNANGDKDVSMSYVIDGGSTNQILDIGLSGTGWTEVMDNGINIAHAASFSVSVNGVATNSLSDEFQSYNPVIAETGSELTLIITMSSGIGGFGGIGMDNLVLNGTLSEPPAPDVDYDSWAAAYGLEGAEAGENYDVEPDGLDNLMEYALGGDPTIDDAAAVAPLIFTGDDGGTNWFYHVYDQRVDDDALTFTLGATEDLTSAVDTNDVLFVGQSDEVDGFRTQTNRTEASSTAKFISLEVQK